MLKAPSYYEGLLRPIFQFKLRAQSHGFYLRGGPQGPHLLRLKGTKIRALGRAIKYSGD